MVLAIPVLGFIGYTLDAKFQAMDSKISLSQETNKDRIDNVERQITARVESNERASTRLLDSLARLSDKVIAIETTQTQEAANFDRFQSAVLTRLDRFQDSQVAMSNNLATLSATLQSLVEQRRIQNPTIPLVPRMQPQSIRSE